MELEVSTMEIDMLCSQGALHCPFCELPLGVFQSISSKQSCRASLHICDLTLVVLITIEIQVLVNVERNPKILDLGMGDD